MPVFPKEWNRLKVLLIRGVLGSGEVLFFIGGIKLIPITISFVIYSMKGVFIILISIFFSNEIPSLPCVLLMLSSIFAILLLVDPSIIPFLHLPSPAHHADSPSSNSFSFFSYLLGCSFILSASLVKAGINVLIRHFGRFTSRQNRTHAQCHFLQHSLTSCQLYSDHHYP